MDPLQLRCRCWMCLVSWSRARFLPLSTSTVLSKLAIGQGWHWFLEHTELSSALVPHPFRVTCLIDLEKLAQTEGLPSLTEVQAFCGADIRIPPLYRAKFAAEEASWLVFSVSVQAAGIWLTLEASLCSSGFGATPIVCYASDCTSIPTERYFQIFDQETRLKFTGLKRLTKIWFPWNRTLLQSFFSLAPENSILF